MVKLGVKINLNRNNLLLVNKFDEMKCGVVLVAYIIFLLTPVSEAIVCTETSLSPVSEELSCNSVNDSEIIGQLRRITNPSGGPIQITITIDADITYGYRLAYIESTLDFFVTFLSETIVYYDNVTFTTYTPDVYIEFGGNGTISMTITTVLLDNPCTTSMNIVWDFPNPAFDISCDGTSSGEVHSTWAITTPGIMKFDILNGESSNLGFYDGASKSSPRLYPTTVEPHAYSTGTQMFVTFDNNIPGPQNLDISFNFYDLCTVGSTDPQYWLSQGTFSCNGMQQVTAMLNIYAPVDNPSIVPPISEGQMAIINIDVTNQGNHQSVFRVYTGFTNYDMVVDNTTFTLPFSEREFLTIQVFNMAYNPSVTFTISWQIIPQSSNPCLSSTSLTLPQTSGWIGCRSQNYDIIPSIVPHTGSWLIQAPPDTLLYLVFRFTSFGNDSMIFYDGPSTSSPVLKTFDLSDVGSYPFYEMFASGNTVLAVYSHSALTDTVLWDGLFTYYSVPSPCEVSVELYRTAETGRIQCASVSPNLSSVWQIDSHNGPISLSIDSINFVPGESITINDVTTDNVIVFIDSTFNKTGAYITTASTALYVYLSTPSSITKRTAPGSFQISYSTSADLCEIDSTLYFETTRGTISCFHIKPGVTSTIIIVPNNGDLIFYYDYYLSNGSVVVTDLHGNEILDSYFAFGNYISKDGGIIIHFQSGDVDSYVNGDYFEFYYDTFGSLCGTGGSYELTTPQGIFGCPEGTNNGVDSYWLIDPNNGIIIMKFATADLEDGYDYVEIWDGSDSSGDYLGKFSSIPTNNSIIAYSGSAYVHLHTDVATTSNGFEIVFTSGVQNACLTTVPVQFSDPYGSFGCPDGIAANVNSFWLISVPESDGVVEARFTEFSLTYPNILCVDYPNFRGQCYDANSIPDVIVSTTNQMTFTIETYIQEAGGFYIEYTTVQYDPCKLNRTVTLSANSNSFGCVTGISQDVTSGWVISPDDMNFITLTFSEFFLDSDSHISVYNGNTTNPSTLLGTFTGTSLPPVVVSTGPYMYVYLVAGDENAAQRFRATYTTNTGDPCASSLEETILTSSGTFGCQHGVLPSVHSSWLVAPQSNNIIEFTIEYATLCSQCRLTIYDGSSTSADVLFRGNQTTNVVLYTTHSVALVTVDTIPNSSSNGFLIYFVTAIPPSPSPNIILPSATTSPIPEGFSRSASPAPLSPTQSPFSQTPVFRTRTASVSRTNFPQASQQVSTRTATPEPPTESPSASMSTTPEPVFPSTTATHSRAPQFTIVPFSPSNFPTSVATVIPSRRVRDMYTLDIELTCKTSATTCCNNFQTLWVDLSTTNYYDLVDINSCVETSSGNIEVSLDQYGSQFFSAEQILDDYWKKASCNGKPLTGDICNVSGRGLSTSLWDISSMVVDGIAGIPSPLPYYYYEEVIYIGESSVITLSLGFFAFILVIFA